jgi:hypothetical protein
MPSVVDRNVVMWYMTVVRYAIVQQMLLLDTVTIVAEKASINNKLLPVHGTLKCMSQILTSGDTERSK